MTAIIPDIKVKLKSWTRHDSFYHLIFWMSLFVVMFVTSISSMGWVEAFLTDIVNVVFFALIAYFNYFILFPKYLKDKNLWWHFGALALTSVLLTPIKTICLYFISNGNNILQTHYVENQLYIFLSTFFVGTSTTIYKVMNDWLIQQRNKKDLESQTLQSELKFLKSQINPHFLFNTLNSLYALTLKKSDLAPEIVLKLSEMMRYMLYECNEKEVPLRKEINYMQNYLELEKLRHGAKMLIDFKINGHIDGQKISPLILIPFIENSFKHGINNQVSQGFVNLELNVMEHDIQMIIENSKSTSRPKIGEKRTGGIGLVNVKRRMDILYADHHHLEIKESPNTYKIELNLNLLNN
ncbi:MAG: histidine kinase [Saprospiraceae bacterium]|nr:histidine kinase [Saprospiraceae bacterium]